MAPFAQVIRSTRGFCLAALFQRSETRNTFLDFSLEVKDLWHSEDSAVLARMLATISKWTTPAMICVAPSSSSNQDGILTVPRTH